MRCENNNHQHSGLVSLERLEHLAFDSGLGAEYRARDEDGIKRVCDIVTERLGLPEVDIMFAVRKRVFGEYYSASLAVARLGRKRRAVINLRVRGRWETVAHELAHHIVRNKDRTATPHGKLFKQAFGAVIPIVAAALPKPATCDDWNAGRRCNKRPTFAGRCRRHASKVTITCAFCGDIATVADGEYCDDCR